MKTISIIGQKGGAGKSTVAINLAGMAEHLGFPSVIIDLDPQISAKSWHDHRQKESPVVISSVAKLLDQARKTAEDAGAAFCFVDTAPHSANDALIAAKSADLIIIPCRAAFLDLQAVETTVDLIGLARKPAIFLLNAIRPGDKSLPEQATEFLQGKGIPVCPVRLSQRAAFGHAMTAGQTVVEYDPHGAATEEIRELFMHACNHVGIDTQATNRKKAIA